MFQSVSSTIYPLQSDQHPYKTETYSMGNTIEGTTREQVS